MFPRAAVTGAAHGAILRHPKLIVKNNKFLKGLVRAATVIGLDSLLLKSKWFFGRRQILGIRGANFLDAGFVYMPYIPIFKPVPFLTPADFSKSRPGLMTRYAKKLVNKNYYGTVTIKKK